MKVNYLLILGLKSLCHQVGSDFSITLYLFPRRPLCITPHASLSDWPILQWIKRSLICLFCHIIYLQFGAKNPIILSAFPVMPPSAFAPSLIGSNPKITRAPFVTSSISTLKNAIIPPPLSLQSPSFFPRWSSHPSLPNRSHSSSAGVAGSSLKKRRTSLASANVCNASHGGDMMGRSGKMNDLNLEFPPR